jgi:formamidopyrimidine-DNA glycosylase
MPELPEVEVTRLGLLPHLLQRRIITVSWSAKRLRLPIPRKLLRASIQGNTITAIERRAKYLLIRMRDNSVLVFHLGMTGKLGMFPATAPGAVHDHLRLRLDNEMEMRFNDARRFGSIMVWPAEQATGLEEEFNRNKGIEPLSPEFSAANLARLARRRSMPIKTFLMDSRIIAGIGNIYANETLFAASIHPQTKVNSLSEKQWQKIATCCQQILTRAIEAGGSTISDFLGSSGQPGYFQLQLAVYGKKDEPCPGCGAAIRKETLAGRATFFCATCQPR